MYLVGLLFKKLFLFPLYLYYQIYDHLIYKYYRKYKLFDGWGIHLFTENSDKVKPRCRRSKPTRSRRDIRK